MSKDKINYSLSDMFPIEDIREFCIEKDIHEVCIYCLCDCKEIYSYWSGQMPPDMFCDVFQESKLAEIFTKLITKVVTNTSD